MITKHSKIIMALGASSIVFWLFISAGLLLTFAQIGVNFVIIYAGYTGYSAASEKVQSKVAIYIKLLAIVVLLGGLSVWAIAYRYANLNTTNCNEQGCATGFDVMKYVIIGLFAAGSCGYNAYALFSAWRIKSEFSA
jgi:uncharacterized SAM-binding protein YcdF (DUF218 family)